MKWAGGGEEAARRRGKVVWKTTGALGGVSAKTFPPFTCLFDPRTPPPPPPPPPRPPVSASRPDAAGGLALNTRVVGFVRHCSQLLISVYRIYIDT